MSRRFVVNAPAVVSEVIDGEAVIMNLRLGHYYSTRDVGAITWQALEQGHAETTIASALAARFGLDAPQAADAVATFVRDLLSHDLLREANAPEPGPLTFSSSDGLAWSAPTVAAYTDMEDLLLLDPIHDVAAAGWPMPKSGDDPA